MDQLYQFIEKFFVPAVLPILTIFLTYYLQNRKINSIQNNVENIENDVKDIRRVLDVVDDIYKILYQNEKQIIDKWFEIVKMTKYNEYKCLVKTSVDNQKIEIWIYWKEWENWNLFINFNQTISKNRIANSILDNDNWHITDDKKSIYHVDDENINHLSASQIYQRIKFYMDTINANK